MKKIREVAMSLPSMFWLLFFFLIPTLLVFAYAFLPEESTSINYGWTLETFSSIFHKEYLVIIWRTLWLSAVTTIACISISLPIGFYLAQASEKVQKIFLLLIIMPFWSSFLVRIFAWKTLLHPEGFLKQALTFMHIIDEDTFLLYNIGTVLVVMVYSYLPFAILPIYTQAVKFNFYLIEAALDLGASMRQSFFWIFIPSIRRGITTALVMVFIPAIGAYIIPDLVGGVDCEMIGNKIAQRIFTDRNLPQASAFSALLSLCVFLPLAFTALLKTTRPKEDSKKSK